MAIEKPVINATDKKQTTKQALPSPTNIHKTNQDEKNIASNFSHKSNGKESVGKRRDKERRKQEEKLTPVHKTPLPGLQVKQTQEVKSI